MVGAGQVGVGIKSIFLPLPSLEPPPKSRTSDSRLPSFAHPSPRTILLNQLKAFLLSSSRPPKAYLRDTYSTLRGLLVTRTGEATSYAGVRSAHESARCWWVEEGINNIIRYKIIYPPTFKVLTYMHICS